MPSREMVRYRKLISMTLTRIRTSIVEIFEITKMCKHKTEKSLSGADNKCRNESIEHHEYELMIICMSIECPSMKEHFMRGHEHHS